MTTSTRILQLLSLLQTHRFWSGDALAERLDVSPRTLRRDVDRLRELGYPVRAHRGVAGGYQLQAGAAMPPLVIDDEEAVAIAVGLRTAAGGAVAGIEETSVRAMAKILQVMPPRLRRQVDALQASAVPTRTRGPVIAAETLTLLAQACRDADRVHLAYTRRDGQAGEREVEPHQLVCLGSRWYLICWDLTRHDWRTLRLDRVGEPRRTGARFRPREIPGGDAVAFVRASIGSIPRAHHVEVTVVATPERVRAVTGHWADVVADGEGAARMTMDVDSFEWPLVILAELDADFTVHEPPALIDHLRRAADRYTRATPAAG